MPGSADWLTVALEPNLAGLLPQELALEPLDLVRLHLQLHLQRVVLQFESPAKKKGGSLYKNPLFIGCEIHPFARQDHATWEKPFEEYLYVNKAH